MRENALAESKVDENRCAAPPENTGQKRGSAKPVTTGGKQGRAKALAVADEPPSPLPVGDWPERAKVQTAKSKAGVLTLQGTMAEHQGVTDALASSSADFQSYCLGQLLNILPAKDTKEFAHHLNAALAMLAALAPRDELEAMLAVQMIAANHAALDMTGRAVRTDRMDFKQAYGGLATKFSRTFIAQLEALGRHRRGGKQIVEHVHVNAGGQAVIANTVTTGGRG